MATQDSTWPDEGGFGQPELLYAAVHNLSTPTSCLGATQMFRGHFSRCPSPAEPERDPALRYCPTLIQGRTSSPWMVTWPMKGGGPTRLAEPTNAALPWNPVKRPVPLVI